MAKGGKKQKAIKQLRHAYIGLRGAKIAVVKCGGDPEYDELISIAKQVFFEAHCACHDAGVDPTPLCLNLAKVPLKRNR